MTKRHLSQADIAALLAGPTEDVRAEIALKVGGQVSAGVLTGDERLIANDILRLMVRDAADRVRQAMAQSIANTKDVPREVALKLAHDIDDIAVPFLGSSPALSDEDLVSIVRAGSDEKSIAVAGRAGLGSDVCDAIANDGGKDAVVRMLGNEGAEIAPASFGTVMERWQGDEDLADTMACRQSLPVTVAERLVAFVSDEIRVRLMSRHALREDIAARMAIEAREMATISLLDGLDDVENFDRLMDHLHVSGRLTGTLILRAACLGEMRFVEHALARLTRIMPARAWTLVHDTGGLGLRALFQRAELASELYLPLRTAVDVFHETGMNGAPRDREHFRRTLIERILTQTDSLSGKEMDFLLYQISRQELKITQPDAATG
ncbi:DUF2336 domain-containing protein [Pyruvatibacter sp.]|uniref:DUF2336 domain-containing protein n=1 Tax=Pyruvatibacter sp. TaxID=1981328 RepID=UPI0032EDC1B7